MYDWHSFLFVYSFQYARGNFPFFKIGIALPLLKLHFFWINILNINYLVHIFLKWEYVYLY